MGYTAGTLDLSILGASNSAVASIDKTVKSLNSLSRAINKINNTQFVLAGQKLEVLFNKIAQATNSINIQNLDRLAIAAKSLNSISKLSSLGKTDWSKVSAGFTQLAISITPFIDKIKEAEASLTALYGVIQKVPTNKMQDLSSMLSGGGILGKVGGFLWSGVEFLGKTAWNVGTGLLKGAISLFKKPIDSFGKLLKISTWTGAIYAAKRIGSAVANIAKNGADFSETLNLWQVSMGEDLIPQATEFVNKLNEAYGISKKTLMNSQAIFKNMLGSLGELTSEQAYALSEGITQMALDYASLYNVKFEDAMTKFQAALAGQVRPIRSVSGYDITENTLFQLYQTLGGTKTMRQLSRTEKQLLAIYAVFEQMDRSGAIGDLNRTINSFANQSRVFADAWSDVKTYAGIAFTSILENLQVMPYINAGLIFLARLFEGIGTSMKTGLGDSAGVFGETEGAIEDTTEAVEELQSALLDFDKFRSLDNGLSANNNVLGIDQTIIDAMTRYDGILEGASLEARKLADSWLESIGWLENGELKIKSWQDLVDDLKSKVENINWLALVSDLSNKLQEQINKISERVLGLNWEQLGKDVAQILESFNVGNTIISSLDLTGNLLQGLVDAFNSFISTEEWDKFKTDFTNAMSELVDIINETLQTINWTLIKDDLKEFFESPEFKELANTVGDIIGGAIGDALVKLLNGTLKFIAALIMELFISPIVLLVEALVNGVLGFVNLIPGLNIENVSWHSEYEKWYDDWLHKNIYGFASGGLPDKGSMFVAGEAGAEMVYNMPSGQSGVANIAQIAQATYSGTIKALNDWWGGSEAKGDIPQLKEANPTGMYQAVTGVARQYGKGWSKM